MKKLIFTLSLFCFIAATSNAQYCGNSGPSVCTPQVLTAPGLSPKPAALDPVIDGIADTRTIEFQNYDTLTFSGQSLTMDSLTVVQITNIPSGYCWATNKTTNTFANQENGCIKVTGLTWAMPGQYKLDIVVKAYTSIGFPLTTNADAAGLFYYVRVNCDSAQATQPVDTTQTSADSIILYSSNPYNLTCTVGVKDVDATVQSLNVFPNPMNGNQSTVAFNSAKAGMMTEKITSIIGATVYSSNIEVRTGYNSHAINRNGMAAGVYFYTISDGTNSFTKKIVVE